MDRIAIIGWGSLLWDLDDLEPHVTGDWYMAQGPTLPIEFTLVSRKRNRALAAVIDHTVGEHCTASVIQSSKGNLPAAVSDLAQRERCDQRHIGALHRSNGFARAKQSRTTMLVREWLHTTHYHAAVWTDTESNFEATTGEAFSLTTAVEYLKSLPEDSLREAKRYIENAPVSTPLRRELQDKTWWMTLDY
ncbi:MAG: hypothetical protein OEN20_01440 [Gammaproteobacteria bacterium]|nr:hypothetical protein [Gammaproteobacteria bacterium]